jgi:DNA-directed RNA polymerase subunit RPC12/RpoP
MEFFRHCPQCGRRFHIKLETKKLVTSHQESIPTMAKSAAVVQTGVSPGSTYVNPLLNRIEVREGAPIIVQVEEFQYAYRCKHCGHEWSEEHTEELRET